MQGTVHRFDPATGTGSVVTDDGIVLPFGAQAVADSRLRHLRVGQRLSIVVEGHAASAAVTAMNLGTVGQVPEGLASSAGSHGAP